MTFCPIPLPTDSGGLPDLLGAAGRGTVIPHSLTPSGWGSTVVHSANIYQLLFMHQTMSCMPRREESGTAFAQGKLAFQKAGGREGRAGSGYRSTLVKPTEA